MPAPSQLVIATKAVQRLVKEERLYHEDLIKQQNKTEKMEADIKAGGDHLDENAEYMLKQERQAMKETESVFAPLRQRIESAIEKLKDQIAISERDESASELEMGTAREALTQSEVAVKNVGSA